MITGELKAKVDRIWDAFWSGGIANPLEVMEQITYLLFIRRLDDLQTAKENRANRLGTPIDAPIFPAGSDTEGRPYGDLRWSRFKDRDPTEMFAIVGERVFPFMRQIGGDGSTYSHHMRDARFTIPTPALLVEGGRPARRPSDGGSRHQGRRLRVHALQDRHRRPERPVPHAPPHHRADGRHDRADAEGRDLRPRVRHRWFPDRRERVRARTRTRSRARPARRASTSTTACSTASTSTARCCGSAR